MKRILVNATHPEEVRVALVDGGNLQDLDVEPAGKLQRKSNIYKGRIVRIEPGLDAAFVDYGGNRHGFLPLKDVARHLFRERQPTEGGRVSIQSVLQEQQELVVQVDKEERGNKGVALTTFISLAGRYLVLMPNNPRAGGVSRQIEGDERKDARAAMSDLNIPQGMGLILRTAGIGKSSEELRQDMEYLLQLWQAVQDAAAQRSAPFLIHQESETIIRVLRDHFRPEIAEIQIDNEEMYQHARDFALRAIPEQADCIKHYQEDVPLFTRYRIENQINLAFSRNVKLPAGGVLVIDQTEALITIDINSARATQGNDIEQTALNTNLEAADEIARQLRLRDLGGLIVIDFIDMRPSAHQRNVENRLRAATRLDRARVQIGPISRFGLLEMSRQRLSPSLSEAALIACPRCDGSGKVRSVESLALNILRLIEEEASKKFTSKIVAHLPVDTATFLLNEKRQNISDLQERNSIEIVLIPDPKLNPPGYSIQQLRASELQDLQHASYAFPRKGPENDLSRAEVTRRYQRTARPETEEQPALANTSYKRRQPVTPSRAVASNRTAASEHTQEKEGISFAKRWFLKIFGGGKPRGEESPSPAAPAPAPALRGRRPGGGRRPRVVRENRGSRTPVARPVSRLGRQAPPPPAQENPARENRGSANSPEENVNPVRKIRRRRRSSGQHSSGQRSDGQRSDGQRREQKSDTESYEKETQKRPRNEITDI